MNRIILLLCITCMLEVACNKTPPQLNPYTFNAHHMITTHKNIPITVNPLIQSNDIFLNTTFQCIYSLADLYNAITKCLPKDKTDPNYIDGFKEALSSMDKQNAIENKLLKDTWNDMYDKLYTQHFSIARLGKDQYYITSTVEGFQATTFHLLNLIEGRSQECKEQLKDLYTFTTSQINSNTSQKNKVINVDHKTLSRAINDNPDNKLNIPYTITQRYYDYTINETPTYFILQLNTFKLDSDHSTKNFQLKQSTPTFQDISSEQTLYLKSINADVNIPSKLVFKRHIQHATKEEKESIRQEYNNKKPQSVPVLSSSINQEVTYQLRSMAVFNASDRYAVDHYAYVKHGDTWWYCNDDKIQQKTPPDTWKKQRNSFPYLLFYERVESEPPKQVEQPIDTKTWESLHNHISALSNAIVY